MPRSAMIPAIVTLAWALACQTGCACAAPLDERLPPDEGETGEDETGETGEDETDGGEPLASPCDDDPVAAWLGIDAPRTPAARVKLPIVDWVEVRDTAELVQALAEGRRHLRLAPGVYTADAIPSGPLVLAGQQLWADEPGSVRLQFGVAVGGVDSLGHRHHGAELHGLVFDIHEVERAASAASEAAAILAWGDATGLVVEDCQIFGNGRLTAGIYVTSADGLRVARVQIRDVSRFGVHVGGPTPSGPASLRDLYVSDVHGGEGSTWGVGLRLASPAEVERVAVREVRFAGLVTLGDSVATTLRHVDVDRVGLGDPEAGGVGVYFDDTTRATTLERFCIGRNVKIGVNSEWDHLGDPSLAYPRGIDNVVRYGLSEAWYAGIHFDQGTVHGQVHDVVLRGYQRAGIIFYRNVSAEQRWPDYDDGSVQYDNVFEQPQIDCRTCDVSTSVWTSQAPVCLGGAGSCPLTREAP